MGFKSLTRRSFLEKGALAASAIKLGNPSLRKEVQSKPSIVPTQLGAGEKLRVGILGCGARSPAHIKAVNHYDQMEVGALCDILPEKMNEKLKLVKSGNPRLYTDYEEMLKQEDIHAIAIVLPNTLHRPASVSSLDSGKHVLCEKPLTLDVAGCKAIIEAADRNRKVIQVGTQSRHYPDYVELARQIHNGLVGQVLYAWIHTFRVDWRKLHPDPEVDARINWRMKQEEGGAVIYEQGIHTIDLFNWFLDSQPEEISSIGGVHNKTLEKRSSWDHAGVMVRYANDALVTYGGNLYSCGGPGPNILFGEGGSLEVGDKGSGRAALYTRTYWRPYAMGEDPRAKTKEIFLPKPSLDPSTLQYGHFLDAVQGKAAVFPSARDHLPAVQIARGALMSMAQRRHIRASEVL